LMCYVFRLKRARTNSITLEVDAEHALAMAAELDDSPTRAKIALLDELDKVLAYHSGNTVKNQANGLDARLMLQAQFDESGKYVRSACSDAWRCDFLSRAIIYNLKGYVESKLASNHSLIRPKDGLPLLTYALAWELWSVKTTVVPRNDMLEVLLRYGADPNELYDGHSIWQYTLHYVHSTSSAWLFSSDQSLHLKWEQALNLMLEYGADPNTCCFLDSHAWANSLRLTPDCSVIETWPELLKHSENPPLPPIPVPRDERMRNLMIVPIEQARKKHHAKHHSFQVIISTVFGDDNLVAMLEIADEYSRKGPKILRRYG
jgi:hypothetical protein